MEPSAADFVILGFLSRGALSGYDVSRRMAATTAHFYRTSFGSIYPSLARLEAEGLVSRADSAKGGRARKAYRITAAGRKAFRAWLASPLDIASGPSLLLARIFFLGELGPPEAAKALAGFAKGAAARRARIEGALDAAVRDLGDGCGGPDFYQAATHRFGLEYYAFLEGWLVRAASEPPRRESDDAPGRNAGGK